MNTKVKNLTIVSSDYKKILQQIQQSIAQTQSDIANSVTRKKVEMAWQIGRVIYQNLPKNDKVEYGKKLIEKLENDTLISKTVLYKMRNFYKTYPKIPKDDNALNWSHYRILSGIKKADERKVLEDLTKKNGWEVSELQEEVKKTKIAQILENKALKAEAAKNIFSKNSAKNSEKKKITPQRGKLFSYQVKQITGSKKYFLDCGFGVFREIKETLSRSLRSGEPIVSVGVNHPPLEGGSGSFAPRGGVLSGYKLNPSSDRFDRRSSLKGRMIGSSDSSDYVIKKLAIQPQQLHTYKAFLEKVVDGDTIRVNLDLGFGIFHHEILRLAKINSPEMALAAGKKSKKALERILKDVPFLIVKSIKTDIYGRYVADVFFSQNLKETNLQKVADSGIYLNQLLLDQGVAEIF